MNVVQQEIRAWRNVPNPQMFVDIGKSIYADSSSYHKAVNELDLSDDEKLLVIHGVLEARTEDMRKSSNLKLRKYNLRVKQHFIETGKINEG